MRGPSAYAVGPCCVGLKDSCSAIGSLHAPVWLELSVRQEAMRWFGIGHSNEAGPRFRAIKTVLIHQHTYGIIYILLGEEGQGDGR